MDGVVLNVLSGETIQSQYLYQQGIFMLFEIVIEVLCLFSTNCAFFRLYCLEYESVVECSKEKLATFATLCIRLFLHLRKIAPDIKRTK
jgi:predicted alpha-1,6-mannanase (GH76 family)